jgi:ubiquinone/menaquinone biosynthesis C-methylase UbiE
MTAHFSAETLAAYERWAPRYPPTAHNPLMRAEQQAMLAHWPQVAGRRALDLACGTGRYSRLLAETGAAQVVAMDFCAPMLRQVSVATRVCGSMMQLPFAAQAFDVVISGLALGHASNVHLWMAEAARVLKMGGALLYSDFHPEAARVGLPRSFKDQSERTSNCVSRFGTRKSSIVDGPVCPLCWSSERRSDETAPRPARLRYHTRQCPPECR